MFPAWFIQHTHKEIKHLRLTSWPLESDFLLCSKETDQQVSVFRAGLTPYIHHSAFYRLPTSILAVASASAINIHLSIGYYMELVVV